MNTRVEFNELVLPTLLMKHKYKYNNSNGIFVILITPTSVCLVIKTPMMGTRWKVKLPAVSKFFQDKTKSLWNQHSRVHLRMSLRAEKDIAPVKPKQGGCTVCILHRPLGERVPVSLRRSLSTLRAELAVGMNYSKALLSTGILFLLVGAFMKMCFLFPTLERITWSCRREKHDISSTTPAFHEVSLPICLADGQC